METPLTREERYLKDLLHRCEKDSASWEDVTPNEAKMVRKFKELKQQGQRIAQEFEAVRQQIEQAKARQRSLELQLIDNQGKAQGVLETLALLMPEEEKAPEEVVAESPVEAPQEQGEANA